MVFERSVPITSQCNVQFSDIIKIQQLHHQSEKLQTELKFDLNSVGGQIQADSGGQLPSILMPIDDASMLKHGSDLYSGNSLVGAYHSSSHNEFSALMAGMGGHPADGAEFGSVEGGTSDLMNSMMDGFETQTRKFTDFFI